MPLFHRLEGAPVVVAGQGEGAVWKAELMAASGARVRLFVGEDPSGIASSLKRVAQQDGLDIIYRPWTEADLEGARLAIALSESEEEARAFVTAGHAAGALVNIIDTPEFCDFQFGAVVNRNPLVIGIGTNGTSPALGQALRARLETLLPRTLGSWLELARHLRPRLKSLIPDFGARRSFWQVFAAHVLDHGDQPANEAEALELIEADPVRAGGKVWLVGAGPGDAGLLTLKALKALQKADLILTDDLVTIDVLDLARREARRLNVGKRGGQPSVPQAEICRLMIDAARKGETVVRIKGGDALIFGRATEEIEACRAAGVDVEIIPGITSAQGAAARLMISLTDRHHASRLQYVTAHSQKGGLGADLDWTALAAPDAMTVVYMPRGTISAFVTAGLDAGIASDRPAVIVKNATRPDEVIVHGSFADLPSMFEALAGPGPELVLIGTGLGMRAE